MSIKSNIEEVMKRIRDNEPGDDPDHGAELGEKVRRLAVEAIKHGQDSDEWAEYMSLFQRSEAQLARLRAKDGTGDRYDMDVARTYLVGNGMCGADTTGSRLIYGVEDTLDEGLE